MSAPSFRLSTVSPTQDKSFLSLKLFYIDFFIAICSMLMHINLMNSLVLSDPRAVT